MKIIKSPNKEKELPLQIQISFERIYEFLEEKSKDKNHFYNNAAKSALDEFNKYPVLREGFSDFSMLTKYNEEISTLLDVLFPELLEGNEIKVVSVPFDFTTFKFSKRFLKILENAGDDYELNIRDFEDNKIYILACTFIIAYYYKYELDFKRPFFYDIPDKKSGMMKHYRVTFNGDFFKVKPTADAPKITQEDIINLLDNFENIDVWKEKFPPNSYILSGFGIMNLFDVTQDEILSRLKANLLKKDANSFAEIQKNLATIYNIPKLHFGFSIYDALENRMKPISVPNNMSLLLPDNKHTTCTGYFCDGVMKKVFVDHQILAISDVEKYGEATNFNGFYKSLKSKNIESIILVPLVVQNSFYGVMELGSEQKHQLNSINANKLKDIIPVFTIASQRAMEEHQNRLESVIQENYTSIHSSVKWRFYQAVESHIEKVEQGDTTAALEEIVFDDVYPLYGQCDIKGSSVARNTAIQEDLSIQLNAVITVLRKTLEIEKLPIYEELIFRTENYIKAINKGLKTGDEVVVTQFLTRDISPVFRHLKNAIPQIKEEVESYDSIIDEKLHIVYQKRREYEEYVTLLNDTLANYIDDEQIAAQEMFPHYFERYKTDGVDFNMYIGQSLVNTKEYNKLYLHNLRLWQLKLMCELENVVYNLQSSSKYSLEVASLILVHSNPLAIKFRMDEKQFDVDGAYNIRYEIIKKRIDKSHIKNTKERVTQPKKIVIIYAQDSDRKEYLKYINYLQSKDYLGELVEDLEIEDLQGISGLKALRVPVNYKEKKGNVSFEELMEVIKNDLA